MAETIIYDWDKKKVGSVDLPDEVFGKAWRADLVQTVVRWQLACRRRGTHKTKTRGNVSGGGIKPYKQKGTGRARRGSTRSPIICGGGTTFGPQPRDYSYKLPRKMKQAGLKVALSYLLREGRLFIVKDMDSEGKTKELATRLNGFGIPKAVLIDKDLNLQFKRASRNLPDFRYYSAEGLNVFDLLKYDHVLLTESSLDKVKSRCGIEVAT